MVVILKEEKNSETIDIAASLGDEELSDFIVKAIEEYFTDPEMNEEYFVDTVTRTSNYESVFDINKPNSQTTAQIIKDGRQMSKHF